jgi:ribosome-associated protein
MKTSASPSPKPSALSPEEEVIIEPSENALQLSLAALEKKAEGLVVLDVRGLVSYCDWFVLCNGTNNRQVSAIALHLLDTARTTPNLELLGVEGQETGRWVLIDCGDVIVHVFHEPLRGYYDLDGLWPDAPRLTATEIVEDSSTRTSPAAAANS